MKERIQQLAEGIVQVDIPELVFFPDRLSREVPAGAVISLEVLVKSRNKIPFKGFFYSSDERVRVCTAGAAGLTGSVTLEICTRNCEAGDEISGELQMVSNAGEKRLLYHFTVTGSDSITETPQTLEEFAALYRENSRRAQRLFTSPHFLSLPFMDEPYRMALYDGMRAGSRDDQALEAFLVACSAKEAVSFLTDRVRDTLEAEGNEIKGAFYLKLSTWGNIRIRMSADMEWLKLERNVLTGDDFTNGQRVIAYRVDCAALHGGRNIGEIVLQSDTQTISYFVEVHKAKKELPGRRGRLTKELTGNLYRMLLEYLNDSYEEEVVIAALDRSLTSCIKKYPAEIGLYLMRIWLLVSHDHKKEARALLEWCRETIAKNRGDMPVEYCIFLYLDSSLRDDKRVTENAYKIIHKYFEAVPSLIIALLELYVIRTAADEEALPYLEELQRTYGSSPLVYALAADIYRRRPELMRADSTFMLYVFNYMVKYQCCPDNVVSSFLRQLAGIRSNGRLLLSVLERLYQDKKSPQILTAVCSILVRQGKTGPKYCSWYEEGVRREIQLTSLNDYYLASLQIDENSRLPINILLYYSYKSELDDRTRLRLYSYVLSHYPKDSDMYRAYEDQMNQFAIAQLLSGRINSRLVLLYETILSPGLVDRRLSRVLPDLLFSRQITTSLPFAVKVVVHYPQLCHEVACSLSDGQACVPVYTDNAAILFEDRYGNRYTDPDCKSEQLMYHAELIAACKRQSPNQLMLLLEETNPLYRKPIQDDAMYDLVSSLLDSRELQDSYRRLLVSRRIDYCYYCSQKEKKEESNTSRALSGEATAWLLALDLSALTAVERARVIELYIMRNCMKEAYQAVRIYGSRLVKVSLLLKMTVRYITEQLYEYDECLLQLGRYLLQKKQWNGTLLTYMAQHYNGTTDSMLRLLQITTDLQADSADLAERVVAQMMFTGNWSRLDDAFDCYCRSGHVSDVVKQAYYVLKCHEYLLGRESISESSIRTVEAAVMKEGKDSLPKGYSLALLQCYGTMPSLNDRQKRLCEHLVYGLCADEIYLGCYQALGRHIEMPHQMEGKVIVQHSGEPKEQVWLEGILQPQHQGMSRMLTEVYPGIYTGAVFLFPDESAEVTLYHNAGKGTGELEKLTLHAAGCYARKDSLYDRLCRSVTLFEEERMEELKRHSARLEREKRVAEDLFTLM